MTSYNNVFQQRLLVRQLKHLNSVVKANNGQFYEHNFPLNGCTEWVGLIASACACLFCDPFLAYHQEMKGVFKYES